MSKNKVQFQKGMSLSDFMASYGDEQQCREAVFQARWPNGFLCPECGYTKCCEIRSRNCFQCNSCHHQTSLLSGTIYEQTKLPLRRWFLASYLLTQQPVRMKMHKVKGFRKEEIKNWSQQQLKADSHVITDGLWAFQGLTNAGIEHESIVTGGGRSSMDILAFHWINTLLGNVKTAMQGTYHSIQSKYLPRYLAEFEYRFNRRFKLDTLVARLVHASAQTPPMPGRLLKLAEASW